MDDRPITDSTVRAALVLQAESVARKVIPALRDRGIEPLVLKGPALAAWLYGGGVERTYGDLDLMVDPGSFADAEGALSDAGYARGQSGWDGVSVAWRKEGQRFAIDLHRSIVGAEAEPSVVWSELSAHATEGELLGVRCRSLDAAGLALHVGTHAAQHAFDGDAKPLEDLRLALTTADAATWRASTELARRIDAEPAFAAGLRRQAEGAELAERLGLTWDMPVDVALRASVDPPPLVLGIEQLSRLGSPRARVEFALSKVFPSATQMRATSALARRGRPGLLAAYAMRPFVVAVRLPAAVARHRSLSRAARAERAEHADDDELQRPDEGEQQQGADAP